MSRDDIDDRMLDALLRGRAASESHAAAARIREVVARIRCDPGPTPTVVRWRRWFVGSAASLATAAVVMLAVLLVRGPEAGASTVLERAAAVAAASGPRAFDVEIDHRGEAPGVEGTLDLLQRGEAETLVRLEVWPGQSGGVRPADPSAGRLMGRDERGPWIVEADGRVVRVDPRRWERHLLGGTAPLVMDDLAGLLAALPRDHDILLDTDPEGRPRLRARRRPAAGGTMDRGEPRGRGPLDGSPGDRALPGPPGLIEVTLDPGTWEIRSLRFSWRDALPHGGTGSKLRRVPSLPGGVGPDGPPPGPPLPAEIRLRHRSAVLRSPSDFDSPNSGW